MLILGDVFAVIATLVGIFLTATAAMLTHGLLFPERVSLASEGLRANPWRRGLLGIGAGVPAVLFGIVVASLPVPLLKAVGILFLLFVMMLSLLGASGIAWLMAARWRTWDPNVSPLTAYSRSAMLLVGACLLPFVGWFLVAPLVLIIGIGLGTSALMNRREQAEATQA